ncbi:MAG: OmpA family protein [Enterobacterales bacterium]
MRINKVLLLLILFTSACILTACEIKSNLLKETTIEIFNQKLNFGNNTKKPVLKIQNNENSFNNIIYFKRNDYNIDQQSKIALDRDVKELLNNKKTINIEGHISKVEDTPEYRLLQLLRANAVKRYFISKGVSSKKIVNLTVYGKNKFIDFNNDYATNITNRSVIISY